MAKKRKKFWKIKVSKAKTYSGKLTVQHYFNIGCIRYKHGLASVTYSAYSLREAMSAIEDMKARNEAKSDVEVTFEADGESFPLMTEADLVIIRLKYSETEVKV